MQALTPDPRPRAWRAPRVGVLLAAWTGLLVWALGFVVIPVLHLAQHARPHVHLPGGGAVFVEHDHHGHHDHHHAHHRDAARHHAEAAQAAQEGAEALLAAAPPIDDSPPAHGDGGADHFNLALWLAPKLAWRLRVWEVQRADAPPWAARSLIAPAIPPEAARGPPALQT